MNYIPSGNLVALAGFLVLVAHYFNINIAQGDVVTLFSGLLVTYGILHSWYDAYEKGHITLGGMRK